MSTVAALELMLPDFRFRMCGPSALSPNGSVHNMGHASMHVPIIGFVQVDGVKTIMRVPTV